ncbi:hypothetical protein H1R20_g14105, partial [Candolleomyces eurysporus]
MPIPPHKIILQIFPQAQRDPLPLPELEDADDGTVLSDDPDELKLDPDDDDDELEAEIDGVATPKLDTTVDPELDNDNDDDEDAPKLDAPRPGPLIPGRTGYCRVGPAVGASAQLAANALDPESESEGEDEDEDDEPLDPSICGSDRGSRRGLNKKNEETKRKLVDHFREPPTTSLETEPSDSNAPARVTLPSQTALKRLAEHLVNLESSTSEPAVRLYDRVTVAVLRHYCQVMEIAMDPSASKRELFERCINESDEKKQGLIAHLAQDENLKLEKNAFLGQDVMEEVWSDMKSTVLPSWVTPVPSDWGTVRRGKLSADNWRIICCIHLPITLIRLFGQDSGRKKMIIDNFMDLVCAVRVATTDTISPNQIELYRSSILRYSLGVKALFTEHEVLPSHHAALHLGDVLENFGPKHAHDSPHYERYINFFHRMNNNHKLGKASPSPISEWHS